MVRDVFALYTRARARKRSNVAHRIWGLEAMVVVIEGVLARRGLCQWV